VSQLLLGERGQWWHNSLWKLPQQVVPQCIEVGVQASDLPLERICLYGDHLGLSAHVTTQLRGDKLVYASDDTDCAVLAGENSLFGNFGLLTTHE